MYAIHDRPNNVTITFDPQAEVLHAPGENKIYLPCAEGCGKMLTVDHCVVSAICETCQQWHPGPTAEGPPNDHATATGMYDRL